MPSINFRTKSIVGEGFEPRQLAALQRHELPAGDGHVAGRAGRVSPAAPGEVLGVNRKPQRFLGDFPQPLVARQAVRLAQRDRCQRMAVHAAVAEIDAVGRDDALVLKK